MASQNIMRFQDIVEYCDISIYYEIAYHNNIHCNVLNQYKNNIEQAFPWKYE